MAFDYLPYQQKASALGQTQGAKLNASIYSRFLNKQRGTRATTDLTKKFEQQTPQVIGGYTKRGLAGPGVQSGIFQKGMSDFDITRQNAVDDLAWKQADEENVLTNNDAAANAEYANAMADLEIQKQKDIADSAATLSAFKPYLGG